MRRETENVLLLLVGISLAMIAITGAYIRYVKPSMLWWLAAAAALLIALSVSAGVRDVRNRHRRQGHDHDGHRHRSAIGWLLLVPIVVLIFATPPPLGAQSARAEGPAPSLVVIPDDIYRHAFPPLPAERAPTLSLREVMARLTHDSANSLDGRLITVIGFTLKRGDQTYLGRYVIVCCAADAQLLRLRLSGEAAAPASTYPDNTWLSVEGVVQGGERVAGRPSVPNMNVERLTPIDVPSDPYE